MANDCQSVANICGGQPQLPGFWEIPMYAIFDERGAAGAHLMDPWLDSANASDVLAWMKSTFTDHYNGKRQPFGVYTHPIHLAKGYPGLQDPVDQIKHAQRVPRLGHDVGRDAERVDHQQQAAHRLDAESRAGEPAQHARRVQVPDGQRRPAHLQRLCQEQRSARALHLQHGRRRAQQLALLHVLRLPADHALAAAAQPAAEEQRPLAAHAHPQQLRHALFGIPSPPSVSAPARSVPLPTRRVPIGPNGDNLTSTGSQNTGSSSASASASADPYRNFGGAARSTPASTLLMWGLSAAVALAGRRCRRPRLDGVDTTSSAFFLLFSCSYRSWLVLSARALTVTGADGHSLSSFRSIATLFLFHSRVGVSDGV
ncbi:hypothetical protein L1887_60191 [Cichorium endivia]|nr:hypothetical protein L1887_60191 [Cichorium endivia]